MPSVRSVPLANEEFVGAWPFERHVPTMRLLRSTSSNDRLPFGSSICKRPAIFRLGDHRPSLSTKRSAALGRERPTGSARILDIHRVERVCDAPVERSFCGSALFGAFEPFCIMQ